MPADLGSLKVLFCQHKNIGETLIHSVIFLTENTLNDMYRIVIIS